MGQARGSAGVLVCVLVALHCCGLLASATTWTVGDSQGWTIGPNYTTWAAGKTFKTGDVLFFSYPVNQHNVLEVNKAGYDACSAANPISTFTAGNTNVTLNSTGTQYFLCSFPGHCTAGMKLAVTVVAAAAPAQAPKSSAATPTPTPTPPTSAPVPSPANGGTPTSSPTPSSAPASAPTAPASTSPPPSPTPSSSTPAPTSIETPPSTLSPPPPSTLSPPPGSTSAPPPSSAPSLPSAASLAAAILCLSAALFAF